MLGLKTITQAPEVPFLQPSIISTKLVVILFVTAGTMWEHGHQLVVPLKSLIVTDITVPVDRVQHVHAKAASGVEHYPVTLSQSDRGTQKTVELDRYLVHPPEPLEELLSSSTGLPPLGNTLTSGKGGC